MSSNKRSVFKGFENRNNKQHFDRNNIKESNKDLYSEIEINNFKAFKNLKIENLKRINVFFGPNNCGKTSILEAVYAHACGLNFLPFLAQVIIKRDTTVRGCYDYGDKLINVYKDSSNPPYKASIVAKLDNKSIHKLEMSFSPSGHLSELDPVNIGQGSIQIQTKNNNPLGFENDNIPKVFLGKWETNLNNVKKVFDVEYPIRSTTSSAHFKLGSMNDILSHRNSESDIKIYTQLKRYDLLGEFIELFKIEFPIVNDIDYIPFPDGVNGSVYIKVNDGRKLPLYTFGDGMRRWFFIIGQMLIYRDAVHCIEEIDATLHPSAQREFSQLVINYANKFNNQLFITSHSIEFADNFLDALYANKTHSECDEFDKLVRIFTLRPPSEENNYTTEIWSLSGREAYYKRKEFGLELR